MAYNDPVVVAANSVLGSPKWNADVVANMLAMAPSVFTTKGDLYIASASKTGVRMGAGSDYHLPYYKASETPGMATGAAGRWWEIEHIEVTGSAQSTIDFESIPTTYKHLRVLLNGLSDAAAASDVLNMIFNDVTTSNYDWMMAQIADAGVTDLGGVDAAAARVGYIAAGNSPSGAFGPVELSFIDYANTSAMPMAMTLMNYLINGAAVGNLFGYTGVSALTSVTSAIGSITFSLTTGDFDVGSNATLYGIM